MKSAVLRVILGVALVGGLPLSARGAEDEAKALPTLLIKGEVVSLDTTDPAATLLKVKDRYGFETPIYLAQETKITQGDQALPITNITAGTAVEVEYNFDVNTAKRHAVSVKVAAPKPTEAVAAAPAPAAAQPVPAAASPEASPAPTPQEPSQSAAPSQGQTATPK